MRIEDLHRKLCLVAISVMKDEALVVPKLKNGNALINQSIGPKPIVSRKRTYVQPSLFD